MCAPLLCRGALGSLWKLLPDWSLSLRSGNVPAVSNKYHLPDGWLSCDKHSTCQLSVSLEVKLLMRLCFQPTCSSLSGTVAHGLGTGWLWEWLWEIDPGQLCECLVPVPVEGWQHMPSFAAASAGE